MRSFVDTQGRTWPVFVHFAALDRCKAFVGVDVCNLDGLAAIFEDPVLIGKVVYCLCKEDADRLGVTYDDFSRAMRGEAGDRAAQAFIEDFADFFPNPRVRAALREWIENRLRAIESPALVGSSPASSASIPVPTPSASST